MDINQPITVKRIESEDELKEAHLIRYEVFVEEQAVDRELEYEFEEESTHYLAFWSGRAVGTARWRPTEKGIKLERFAVRRDARGNGIASALIQTMLQDIPKSRMLYLHAQEQAIPVYEKNGFKIYGSRFIEADIPHFAMKMEH